jgi:hypothetical protein
VQTAWRARRPAPPTVSWVYPRSILPVCKSGSGPEALYSVSHKFLPFGGSQITLSPSFSKGEINSNSLQFSNAKPDDKEQSARFIETAGQVQSENAQEIFEGAIDKIIKKKRIPKRKLS